MNDTKTEPASQMNANANFIAPRPRSTYRRILLRNAFLHAMTHTHTQTHAPAMTTHTPDTAMTTTTPDTAMTATTHTAASAATVPAASAASARPKIKGVADIVFLLDATGSMQPSIDAVKRNIGTFVDKLESPDENATLPVKDWRAAVWEFRDVRADGGRWLVRHPFVRSAGELRGQLGGGVASGGGDEPESLLDALYAVAKMDASPRDTNEGEPGKWRARGVATRVVVVFTDASFHPALSEPAGLDIDDAINAVEAAHIRLTLFAPKMGCYDDLAETQHCKYEAVESRPGECAVSALARFTGDSAAFAKTMAMLAASVSDSVAAESAAQA